MYKNGETNAIVKKRYCFKKGYLQVALGEKEELKKKIMDLLGITRQTYFSTILNNGISNISKAKYDDITLLFNEYSITDIWEVK